MDFIILLFLCFVFLGGVLSLLFLLKKKGDRMANALLALYTFLFSTELLNNALRWSGAIKTERFIHFNLVHFPLWTIYGPLLYIYVRRVVTLKGFHWKDLFFLMPTFLIVGTLFPFYKMNATQKLPIVLEGKEFQFVPWPWYGIWLVVALLFFYAFFTYFRFWQNKKVGYRENQWMKWFVGSYFGFAFMFGLYIFLVWFGLLDPKYDYFVDVVIVFFIAQLAFFGFVQPEVFEGKAIEKILPFVKYRKTGLSDALSLEMKKKLLRVMETEKPYFNNELRLDDLSRLMNLSRNHTSQIINEHFNLSFFDFINKYRVMEAKNLLMKNDENKLNMTQIAYDVGFNNRASFYKAFKKFTEVNPTAYRERANAS